MEDMEEKTEPTTEKICRTCLNNECAAYVNLKSPMEIVVRREGEKYPTNMLDCLLFCLHSERKKDHRDLPMYICLECMNLLKCCYGFIKMAKHSEEKLRAKFQEEAMEKTQCLEIEYLDSEDMDIDYANGNESADTGMEEEDNDKTNLNLYFAYECVLCEYATNYVSNLKRHYVGKHKTEPTEDQLKRNPAISPNYEKKTTEVLQCPQCSKVLKTSYLLECHMNKHKGINPYKCQICSYECRYQSNITRHYKHTHQVLPTAEMLKPLEVSDLSATVIENEENPISCSLCSCKVASDEALKEHLQRTHKVYDSKNSKNSQNLSSNGMQPYDPYIFMCSKCSKRFKLLHILKTHESICEVGKTETGVSAIDSDPAKKPYKCTQCSARFAIPEYLRTHRAVVHRERALQCNICDKRFKLPSQLKNHVARHIARNFKCDQCECSYISQADLNSHIRIHTGELPYACSECPERFRNSDRLGAHRNKVHLNLSFKCTECSEEFKTKAKLQLHRYRHIGMPYKCELCQREFDKRYDMRRHMTGVHHTDISDKELGEMFAKNMQYKNRVDVFKPDDEEEKHNGNVEHNYMKSKCI